MKKVLFILIAIICALTTQAQVKSATTEQEPIFTTNIDAEPEFIGGMERFYARLHRIPYTWIDRMSECQGKVTVMMVIEKDGSLSNIKVLHGFSEKQDQEILRVVKRLNNWKPGMINGKPVRVLCSIPIDFKLAKS